MATDGYAKWSALLAQAKLGVAPAELHGSITGFLCAGRGDRPPELLAALALECDAADSSVGTDLDSLLDRAAADITARLRSRKPIELPLPDAPLAARANAVVDWCRGFLGGLGLSGVLAESGPTDEVHELLADFGRIAAMPLECGDDDEKALDELLDFVRNGVAYIYSVFVAAVQS
jgi:uncharacterized protein YgfB (UPF0149 family)